MPTEDQLDISLESQLEFHPDLTPPPMTPISKELSEQIEREAEAYAKTASYWEYEQSGTLAAKMQNIPFIDDKKKKCYTDAATPWAAKFEQAMKALEDVLAIIPRSDTTRWLRSQNAITDAEALLASWKEEGKEGGV